MNTSWSVFMIGFMQHSNVLLRVFHTIPVSTVHLSENVDCICFENIKDLLGAKRSV